MSSMLVVSVALYFLFAFILGSAFGSFVNVVSDRIVAGKSLLGRSLCDHCKTPLAVLDLVPIISFVGLGARCKYCKKPLSLQYPIVEFVCASLFTVALYVLVQNAELSLARFVYFIFLICTMLVVAIVDFKYSLIPTTFAFFGSLLALLYNYFYMSSSVFVDSVLAAFAGAFAFAVIIILTRGRGMGQGDIVLAFMMGMVLGLRGLLIALFITFLGGAVVALLLVALRRKKFGQTIPFAPFLVLGFLAALFWAEPILNWYIGVLY